MRKALIITEVQFPRSGASANYIQYFALMLKEAGYHVTVLCRQNKEVLHGALDDLTYKGIRVLDLLPWRYTCVNKTVDKYLLEMRVKRIIAHERLSKDDLVCVYGYRIPIYRAVIAQRDKSHFLYASIPVEWFETEDYSDEAYRKQCETVFHIYRTQSDLIFPISRVIKTYYDQHGKLTCLLPPMIDSAEFEMWEKDMSKYRVIIPANGLMKDAIIPMLKAAANCLERECQSIELHITGVKEDFVREVIGVEQFAGIKESIVFHGWMKYEELVKLYQSMHFLFLARETRRMTLANFPSKVPECLCYGIVPIMSKVGDCADLYLKNDINAYLINGCLEEACTEALWKAIHTEKETYYRMSHAARQCAQERFDYHNWVSVVKSAISNTKSRLLEKVL